MAAASDSRLDRVLLALAEAAIPPGSVIAGGDARTAAAMRAYLDGLPAPARQAFVAGVFALEAAPVARHLQPFSRLSIGARQRLLERWEQTRTPWRRQILRGILTPLKFVHFDRTDWFTALGCRAEWPAAVDEQPRWLAQVTDGRAIDEDQTVECDVVVVGTGAGGAAIAYELARRGRAVLMLEEGDYHRRASFSGRAPDSYRKLYRDQGLMAALGELAIPVWAGRSVGGTTLINSGTCYRAPARTLAYWRSRHGLPRDFSPEGLDPYYRHVESMLGVAVAKPEYVGKTAVVVARGAERMGLRHGPLARNAPDCDGQGVCCLGCPTGAKRSTDVSYVPAALERGAQLYTATRARFVDVVAGRARGVTAELRSGRRLRVEARAVVVAGGTFMTPLLLEKSEACRTSGMLGRNLSLHPACKVMALFDERIDMGNAIPQGYAVDQYAEEGLMFEGGSLPLDLCALAIPWTGPRFTELIEQYPRLALFGFMVQDHSRGRVRAGPGGQPLITYRPGARELALMHRGLTILCELFQAAGARRVLPMVAGFDELSTPSELERFRQARIRLGDLEVTAFHPLGTCRLGADPGRSCIGPDHEAHDVAGLYVCDGSALPSSLGVNPQMTIMALSLRAGEILDARLG